MAEIHPALLLVLVILAGVGALTALFFIGEAIQSAIRNTQVFALLRAKRIILQLDESKETALTMKMRCLDAIRTAMKEKDG